MEERPRDLVRVIDAEGHYGEGDGEHFIVDVASFPDTPAEVIAEIDAILDSLGVGHWG